MGLQGWAHLTLWLCWSKVDTPYQTKLKSRSAQRRVTQVTAQGIKVFQLSRAAPVNCGDSPKFIQRFTTLYLKYHLPKFRWNWAMSILQPMRATSMGSRCRPHTWARWWRKRVASPKRKKKHKKKKQKRAKTLDKEIFSNELRDLCLNVYIWTQSFFFRKCWCSTLWSQLLILEITLKIQPDFD